MGEKKGEILFFHLFSLSWRCLYVSSACPVAACSGLCCQSVGAEASVTVSGPRLGDNCEQALMSKGRHAIQGEGLCEGFIPPWGHRTVAFTQKVLENSRKPPLSYRKVKYLVLTLAE